MTATAYQPVPTIAQRRALAADHAKRYRDNQAIADFQAARLRYIQPEPAQFCAVEDEATEPTLREDFVITVLGIATLICLAILFFLGAR